MENYRKTINLLIALLLITSGVSIYALLGKRRAVPAVSLFMYKKDARFYPENKYKTTKFWDNYPYWVLISQGITIHPEEFLVDDKAVGQLPALFFRLHYTQEEDTVLRKTIAAIIANQVDIAILADKSSQPFLASFKDSIPGFVRIIKVTDQLPLQIEQLRLSYFFSISGTDNVVQDIFVPRKELSEVTNKYLRHFSKQGSKIKIQLQHGHSPPDIVPAGE